MDSWKLRKHWSDAGIELNTRADFSVRKMENDAIKIKILEQGQ